MTSKNRIFFRRLGFSRLTSGALGPARHLHQRRALRRRGSVLMALMADQAQGAFNAILNVSPYLALAVTPLGFGFCVFLTKRVFPNSQGSGIPQVIAARQIDDPKARLALVSLRVAFGKVVVMMIGLLCGASIGREGPTVQVGASIMGAIGRRAPIVYHQGLLIAGAAAGIAAAFNTPLAGIVFAIEELSRSFESKTSGLRPRLHYRGRRHVTWPSRRLCLFRLDRRDFAARADVAGRAGLRDRWRYSRGAFQPDSWSSSSQGAAHMPCFA